MVVRVEGYAVRLKSALPLTGRHTTARRWKAFAREQRASGRPLLTALHRFSDPILVAGCQRSGGTLLTRLITSGPGMGDIEAEGDRELAGALLLAGAGGRVSRPGRLCFQTTYLNDRYHEYLAQSAPFQLVWLIRDPFSVVRSMLYNWSRYALNELFAACGTRLLHPVELDRFRRFGAAAIPAVRRACLSYAAKNEQLLEISASGKVDLLVVDYDDLVHRPRETLALVACRTGAAVSPDAPAVVEARHRARRPVLPASLTRAVETTCLDSYRQVATLARRPDGA